MIKQIAGYRPDIQGLRAIAVIAVVLYHARVPGFSGGFIGVDVFFVVSGFVIASALQREILRTGRIDLLAFYGRRVRRLLPAFAGMAIVFLVLVNLLLPIGETQETTTATAIAASLSAANLYVLRSSAGYFDAGDDANPFLHTWSLGVEEQFYLAAPLLLVVLLWAATRTRWSKRRLVTGVLTLGCLMSFGWSVFIVLAGDARSAFYNPGTRVWEIGAGVLLAVGIDGLRVPIARAASMLAFVAVGTAVVLYDESTAFPGLAAVIPVAATGVLIAASPSVPRLRRVLSMPAAVWVGDRSYGWYLWHWPFIVIVDQLWSPHFGVLVAAGVAALVPTVASYRWIEQPIRDRQRTPPSRRLALAFASVLALVLAGGIASHAGAQSRWGVDAAGVIDRDGIAYLNGCYGFTPPAEPCTFPPEGESLGTILLAGDSHALSIADGVVAAGNELGYTVRVAAFCPMIQGVQFFTNCDRYREHVVGIVAAGDIELVVLSHRSTKYVNTPVEAPNNEDTPLTDLDFQPITDPLAAWTAGLAETRAILDTYGVPLVSIDVVPEFRNAFNRTVRVITPTPESQTLSIDELDVRRATVVLAEHSVLDDGHWIDPAEVLCDDAGCASTTDEGAWLYFDDSHLNGAGALALTGLIREGLEPHLRPP